MKNIILGVIGIALVVFVVISSSKNKDNGSYQTGEVIVETYTNPSGEGVSAMFYDGMVTFNWLGNEITLPQAISASGARYANEDESIVFWNKGNEVTIYENDNIVFEGSASVDQNDGNNQVAPNTNTNINTSTDTETLSLLAANEWVWEKTVMNDDTVIEPNQPGAFSLTFTADGRVSGTTDCNGFNAPYELAADRQISFGPAAMTLMFCEGSQEDIFLQNVTTSTGVYFDQSGNLALMLPFDSGSVLFTKKQ